ncbi:hypothetical protein [Nisaea sediminum]|uniref:hypothetical protein n=1 Tax=Nisaea sediminum TaxID=2775867 RepID=UPI001865BC1D|nr:hypothetical protein [Nisaea sediminum]
MSHILHELENFLDKIVFRSYYQKIEREQEEAKVMQKFVAAKFSRGNVSIQFGRF